MDENKAMREELDKSGRKDFRLVGEKSAVRPPVLVPAPNDPQNEIEKMLTGGKTISAPEISIEPVKRQKLTVEEVMLPRAADALKAKKQQGIIDSESDD